MDRVCVIVNPVSARGETARRWPWIQRILRDQFHEFRHHFTEKPSQAVTLTRESLRDGYDLILGVGGDGTFSEISNGFFDGENRPINPEAALGIIPSGTGSDLIRSLKIPRDFRRSVEQIRQSGVRTLDLGFCRFTGNDGRIQHRYFINIADIGLGAEVIHHLSRVPPQKRGTFTYYSGLISCLRHLRSYRLDITTDSDPISCSGDYIIAAVANGSVFGGGMKIATRARLDDGLFDLVTVAEMAPWQVVANTPRLYSGHIDSHSKVATTRARRISITSPSPCPLEMDGEAVGFLPVEFTLLPRAVRLRG